MDKELIKISKYLSFILRHKPDAIALTLDANGWGFVEELIAKTSLFPLSRELIDLVVETSEKQRFALSPDRTRIRANQGHSIAIDLGLPAITPPHKLLHGSAECFWAKIKSEGLKKGNRHHVHLTESHAVAQAVGARYGKPMLLEVSAGNMHLDGFHFYQTANNVWLVEAVPAVYLRKLYQG